MEFIFLGTGAGVPAKQRNVSSLALIMPEYGGDIWLFDCGEATQHQILQTKVKLGKVSKVFISHLHGDHVFGLPGLLGSRSFQGGETPLTIYGPKGIREYIEVNLRLTQTHLTYPLQIVEIKDGDTFEEGDWHIQIQKLSHGVSSYGFRLTEPDQPGRLDIDKVKHELGIQPGPFLQKFKTEETVVLEDGRIIETNRFLGPIKKGRVLAILGDTKPCPNEQVLANGATILVHEATFMVEKEEGANQFFHSSTRQTAECAKMADAQTLILTHISARYKDNGPELLAEAQAIFPNTYLAEDFWSFTF